MALIVGTPGPDTRGGTAETDLIFGRGGADFLSGQEGNDAIFAGTGDDTVAGDDIPLPGGPFVVGPLPSAFRGTPGDNLIFAGAGDDSVIAGFGSDTVFGGAGNDTIRGYGTSAVSPSGTPGVIAADGPDWLFGGRGDDLIFGGGGDDLLAGGAGEDRLVGGRGVDTEIGGAGCDVFVFGRMLEPGGSTNPALDTGVGSGNRDLVLDFHQGEDKLDLSRYENLFGPTGEQAPVFLGTDPFQAVFAPQVRYEVEDGRTVVQIVTPFGNPESGVPPTVPEQPTAEIELAGEHYLRVEDFILRLGPEGYILT